MAANMDWTVELDGIDDETVRLVFSLQMHDIRARFSHASVEEKAALELYQYEINQYLATRSLEVEEITPVITPVTASVGAPVEVSVEAPADPAPAARPQLLPLTAEDIARLHPDCPTFQCVACDEPFARDRCCQGPCGHHYCDEDLETLIRHALTDRSMWPPRCCGQVLPFEQIQYFLKWQLVADFDAKREELDDPRPTYCSIPTCSTYIGQAYKVESIATCPSCNARTCLMCKQAAHGGDCPQDAAVQETLQLAEREGWRRCPGCERMIELNVGCNHMRCLCRTHFCYVCGVHPWKRCACPQWDEARLLARGQQVAQREQVQNVQAVVQHLRQNHDCGNHTWYREDGGGECDDCQDEMEVFIMRCQNCRVQLCRQCQEDYDDD